MRLFKFKKLFIGEVHKYKSSSNNYPMKREGRDSQVHSQLCLHSCKRLIRMSVQRCLVDSQEYYSLLQKRAIKKSNE